MEHLRTFDGKITEIAAVFPGSSPSAMRAKRILIYLNFSLIAALIGGIVLWTASLITIFVVTILRFVSGHDQTGSIGAITEALKGNTMAMLALVFIIAFAPAIAVLEVLDFASDLLK